MKKHPIAAIINFCSNESRFIRACLEQTSLFARQIIVPVCDHFFDGTVENRALLERIYASFPQCQFVEYPYIPEKIPNKVWKKVDPAHFWHSLSRLVGYSFLDEEIEMVLFLDADEVPDGARFAEWLDCSDYHHHTALRLANYWYFREPSNQALQFEDSPVLAKKAMLRPEVLLKQEERDAIYSLLPSPKRRSVTDPGGAPMFHHFSWVRTQDEMLKKVRAWGHKKDRAWSDLVDEEFKGPFKGIDFVHGYQFKKVDPLFGISLEEPRFEAKGKSRVERLSSQELLKIIPFKGFLNYFRT
jgi:hypothetical protein